jgi:tight adherence protein C
MLILLAAVLFVSVTTAMFCFGAAVYAPSSVISTRLRALGWQRPKAPVRPAFKERLEQAMDPLSRAIPLTPSEVSRTRGWLIQAGYREPRHLTLYVGSRVTGALLGLIVVILLTGFDSLMLMVGVAGLGFFLPRLILKRMIRERQQRIRLALPDALDLTVICVEAGLPLDQAMQRVGEDLHHAHPELSDEFHLVNLEMRAGKPRPEALRHLVTRTGVDDVRTLVATLVQTDRFGTSVAQALRVHSDSLRTERRQRAEEAAAKTTIKMIIPLAVFVLPSLIFVTLGPALIELYRTLNH